jgi:glycosyltransferase involved in cell wall biosynthesis
MMDSVHVSRWLSQFVDQEIDFYIYPSKKHKNIHADLLYLVNNNGLARFKIADFRYFSRLHGYIDFFLYTIVSKALGLNMRNIVLKRVLLQNSFDYVHALEIQGAGYLIDEVRRKNNISVKTIITNWGSDIYYFQEYPKDKERIQSALQSATYYSAECKRDYELARSLGFRGIELPCIPNAGGFGLDQANSLSKASERKEIVVKAYGGQFGRGDLVIDALNQILYRYPHINVYLYSVTDDLISKIQELRGKFPSQVRFSSRRNKLSRIELMERFANARIYVGASRSDGISTSFLEALTMGCYPIQTNTSCAGDWTKLGAVASVVPLDSKIIANQIETALHDPKLVDIAQIANLQIARTYLSFEAVKQKALMFYEGSE